MLGRKQFSVGRPNSDQDRWLLWSIACLPALFVAATLGVKILTPALYRYLYREDGIIEWATALAFLAAAGIGVLLAVRLQGDRRRVLAWLYAGLSLGMLIASLEEISWGQRIIGLDSPEFFAEHSTKDEINIHNLEWFPLGPAFILVGFYGAFARLLVPLAVKRRFPLEVDLLTPRYAVATYFLPTFLIYTYYEYVYYTIARPLGIVIRRDYNWDGHFIIGKDQEAIELLLAIGFMVFVFDNWQRCKAHLFPSVLRARPRSS